MSTAHEIALALRAAYLAMHRQTDSHLAPGGATANQFVVLAALAQDSAATQQELVRKTSSDPNTLRAMILLLEGKGLVRRDPHPRDRRARRVTLTDRGRDVYRDLWSRGESIRSRMAGALTSGERAALVQLLNRIAAAVAE